MSEEEVFRVTVMARLDALAAGQERIEKELDPLFDRVRKVEISLAVAKRDVLILGGVVGGVASLIATGILKVLGA